MTLTEEDLAILDVARERLENPSLAIRLSASMGIPVESLVRRIGANAPPALVDAVRESTRQALRSVFRNTAKTLVDGESKPAHDTLHKAAATMTGAVSGFFGPQVLLVELPMTTAIMFRSMLDIARAEGESPQDSETLLNAMQVFAIGSGRSHQDDAAETSYYGVRLALSKAMSDAVNFIASHGIADASAPVIVRFITSIASRFGVVVTQRAVAQTIPVVGAFGGGLVNAVFIAHFQHMARGHFAIRNLERTYGQAAVQAAYRELQVQERK